MRPKLVAPETDALFRYRLDEQINRRHPLVHLAGLIDWPEKSQHRVKVAEAHGFAKRLALLFHALVVLLLVLLWSAPAQAQNFPTFSSTPSLVSGTSLQQGAVYRFSSVLSDVDALVTLTTFTGIASIDNLDDNTSNAAHFRPTIRCGDVNNAPCWVKFDFQFVQAGTNTAVPIAGMVASAQDVDGDASNVREFVEFIGTSEVTVASTTLLTLVTPFAGGVRYLGAVNNQAGAGTDNRYEIYAQFPASTTTFGIAAGSSNAASSCTTACSRQHSITFNPLDSNLASVQICKVSTGAVGTFSFSGDNTYDAHTITTTTASTSKCAPAQGLPFGVATTLTEAATTGFALTGIDCTNATEVSTINGANGGNTVLNVADMTREGSDASSPTGPVIVCTFTNAARPAIQVTKTANASTVSTGGPLIYTVSAQNIGKQDLNTTTAIRDVIPTGITLNSFTAGTGWSCTSSPSALPVVGNGSTTQVNCTRTSNLAPATSASTVVTLNTTVTSSSGSVTNSATVTGGNDTACTSSTPPPPARCTGSVAVTVLGKATVTLVKVSQGGNDSFGFTGTNGISNQTLVTSAGTATGAAQTLTTTGAVTTVTESAPPTGYVLTDIACTGLGSGGNATPNLGTRTVSLDAAATAAGANITCTFTNVKQPALRLLKSLPSGRAVPSDQFTLNIAGAGGPVSATTTGNTNNPSESAVLSSASAGTSYTLSEAGSGGTDLTHYSTGFSCTNALSGGQTPSGTGTSFTLSISAGDDLSCTFTNSAAAAADLSIQKTALETAVSSGGLVNYLLTVRNAGPAGANGAVLRDAAGAGLDCSSASLPALSCSAAGGAACPSAAALTRTALLNASGMTIPTLPANSSVEIQMQCRVTASGTP